MAALLDEKLKTDNVVGEMMHHDTLCLTGEGGAAERDKVSCCEMETFFQMTLPHFVMICHASGGTPCFCWQMLQGNVAP